MDKLQSLDSIIELPSNEKNKEPSVEDRMKSMLVSQKIELINIGGFDDPKVLFAYMSSLADDDIMYTMHRFTQRTSSYSKVL